MADVPNEDAIAKVEKSVVNHRADLLFHARKGLWADPPAEEAWCHEVFDDQFKMWRPRGTTVGTAATVLAVIQEENARAAERDSERPKCRAYNLIDGRSVLT